MGLLKLEDLLALDTRVNINQIDISVLAEYYSNSLNQSIYHFELENGDTIDIDFDKENFCHLVGVEQIAEARLKRDAQKKKRNKINIFLYKGKRGFRKALKGELNFNHLKNLHLEAYEQQEKQEKFNYFHLIHKLITSDNVKVVNFVKFPDSSIVCDFIFHDIYDKALLHLGVEKKANSVYFFPKTFFPRNLTQNNHNKFINQPSQTEIKIVKRTTLEKIE